MSPILSMKNSRKLIITEKYLSFQHILEYSHRRALLPWSRMLKLD